MTLNGNASILACMSINLLNYYLTQNYQFIVIPEFSFTFRHSKCLLYKENSIMILINVISVFPIFILVKLSDFSIILTIQNSLGSIRRMAWSLIMQWAKIFQNILVDKIVKCELEIWSSNFHTLYPTIKDGSTMIKKNDHFAWGIFICFSKSLIMM